MSTIGTQLNWGASYVVTILSPLSSPTRRRARVRPRVAAVTVGLMLVSAYVTLHWLDRAGVEAVDCDRRRHRVGAAAPLVLVADQRLVGSVGDGCRSRGVVVSALVLKWDSGSARDFAYIMIVTVTLTTIAWLA